jgi:uncharacterized protein YcnI
VNGTRRLVLLACTAAVGLLTATNAFAHARMSPSISLANELQLYSLAIPTEKANAYTTKIVLTLPKGFSIDSFVPSPGWTRDEQSTGSGDNAVITQVTWSGGHVPTEEDSLFQFLAQPSAPGTYTFHVQQTYSDGSIVDWSGPESSAAPAPTVAVVGSVAGGGTSVLTIIALVLGALGVLAGGIALSSRGGRALT